MAHMKNVVTQVTLMERFYLTFFSVELPDDYLMLNCDKYCR